MRSPAVLAEVFRTRGLKMTPQRQLLFRLLEGNERHPSAEVLFAEASSVMPGISLRTVYQTLNDLVAMGELRSLDLGGAARFDPNVEDHHHTVCGACGTVTDVHVAAPRIDPIGDPGFVVHHADIVFHGRCPECVPA